MRFSSEFICLLAGPVITILVSAFKQLSIVSRYPKGTAFVLSVITAVISGLSFSDLDWPVIAACIVVPFSTAVATYELAKTAGESKTR